MSRGDAIALATSYVVLIVFGALTLLRLDATRTELEQVRDERDEYRILLERVNEQPYVLAEEYDDYREWNELQNDVALALFPPEP